MTTDDLQAQCEAGQQALIRGDYLRAERMLSAAEVKARAVRDYDTLRRLYMPLQEARRQIRQRCGEGIVALDLFSNGPHDAIDARHVVEHFPFGQLLVAGWMSLEPAVQVRQLARQRELYLETLLGAVYPTCEGRAIVIAPLKDTPLPPWENGTIAQLRPLLPPECLLLRETELPSGAARGSAETLRLVMSLWERLHAPFIAAAEAAADPILRMEAYRRAIEVDYACEPAHQRLADVARQIRNRGDESAAR